MPARGLIVGQAGNTGVTGFLVFDITGAVASALGEQRLRQHGTSQSNVSNFPRVARKIGHRKINYRSAEG
jgi:hypothetical protein